MHPKDYTACLMVGAREGNKGDKEYCCHLFVGFQKGCYVSGVLQMVKERVMGVEAGRGGTSKSQGPEAGV